MITTIVQDSVRFDVSICQSILKGDDSWGSNGDDSWGQPGSWGKHAIGDDDWNWDKHVTPKKPNSDEKWDGKHGHKDDSGAYDDAEFRNKNT